jgi:DNA processing protein
MNDHPDRDLMIAFSLLPFLTPNRTRRLLESFDPLHTACAASSSVLQELLSVTPEQAGEVRNPLTKARRAHVETLRERVVTLLDAEYPPMLREIFDPPLALHVRGDVSLLARPALAMVGSRRASPYGVNAATHLTRAIAPSGLTIVSGLALGIDAAAHCAALDSGGTTIAVLGTGIDVVYPRSNARLFRRIETAGLIVSEFPPGTPPRKENFPIRNRLISGLSHGTVIVEATKHSGSLITARMAAEQGREVFVVPGSIFSAGSEGTHRLAQLGAKLVHDANDVFDELPAHLRPEETVREPEPESPFNEVLAVLSHDQALHIDDIAARLGQTCATVAQSLLQLELEGRIRALPGARYVRAG